MVVLESCKDFLSCSYIWTLGVLSFLTFTAFVYALWSLYSSVHYVPPEDWTMIMMSTSQCFLAFFYYGIQEWIEVILLQRALKILQSNVVSWLFMGSIFSSAKAKSIVTLAFVVVCSCDIALYLYVVLFRSPRSDICRDSNWLLLSMSWLVIAVIVLLLGVRVLRKFYQTPPALEQPHHHHHDNYSPGQAVGRVHYMLPHHHQSSEDAALLRMSSGRSEDDGGVNITDSKSATNDIANTMIRSQVSPAVAGESSLRFQQPPLVLVGSHIEQKMSQLFTLVGIEAFSALVTAIWDTVLLTQMRQPDDGNCEHFLHHIPSVELAVYIVTRLFGLLVPHWAVFIVFYWKERHLHRPFSTTWDVDLPVVEFDSSLRRSNDEDPPPVEDVGRTNT